MWSRGLDMNATIRDTAMATRRTLPCWSAYILQNQLRGLRLNDRYG